MGNPICITISVGCLDAYMGLQGIWVVGLWTGEGGGENFQLPSALGNLPKNVLRYGCLLRNKNGRGSRERSTSMNARVWGRRPTEDKENPGPATSRHAYNYKEGIKNPLSRA